MQLRQKGAAKKLLPCHRMGQHPTAPPEARALFMFDIQLPAEKIHTVLKNLRSLNSKSKVPFKCRPGRYWPIICIYITQLQSFLAKSKCKCQAMILEFT